MRWLRPARGPINTIVLCNSGMKHDCKTSVAVCSIRRFYPKQPQTTSERECEHMYMCGGVRGARNTNKTETVVFLNAAPSWLAWCGYTSYEKRILLLSKYQLNSICPARTNYRGGISIQKYFALLNKHLLHRARCCCLGWNSCESRPPSISVGEGNGNKRKKQVKCSNASLSDDAPTPPPPAQTRNDAY